MRQAHSGRARISLRRPRALGECDRCGFWHNRASMLRQFQYAGNGLIDTGLVVGRDCLDVPQSQYRTPILPADPVPIYNPRQSFNITPIGLYDLAPPQLPTTPGNYGFTQLILVASTLGNYPLDKATVLSDVAQLTGVPVSGGLVDQSTVIQSQNISQALFPFNPARQWILVYNPSVPQVQMALGTIASFPYGGLASNGGALQLLQASGWPASPVGLPPGAVWNNFGEVAVIPGYVLSGAPLFFGGITAPQLLSIGGQSLPSINPNNPGQLWSDGGVVAISGDSGFPPALWGQSNNLIIGPGEAWFFATSQGLGTVFQGAMSVVGLTPGVPLFAWEA